MMGFMKRLNKNLILFLLLVLTSMNACSSSPVLQNELVIEYQRSGGYAGVDERYSIFSDGLISTNKKREWWADTRELNELIEQIKTLGFYDLATEYAPKNACCDRFSFRLKVMTGNKAHSVNAMGGDPRVPKQFWEVLKAVQGFVDKQAGNSQK